jgi:two-component system, sensor histidine kinase and response regulator
MAKKILIIDDEPSIVEMLIGQLTAHGFDTESASDGESGYIKAGKYLPDAILMDVVMPGWNGLYTANRLQNEPATAKTPIIFLTGLSEDSVPIKYLEQRKYFVLMKPFKIEELLAILSNDLGMQNQTVDAPAVYTKPSLNVIC